MILSCKITLLVGLLLCVGANMSQAAIGCSLNEPDRDVRRIFPRSTGYKTEYLTIQDNGGKPLLKKIEDLLRSDLDPVFEAIDVPYTYYDVLRGKELIGRIHGVNQKGRYGGMQLILATDLDGVIVDFYYQKISSPESKKFRSSAFTEQFAGLTLTDFVLYRNSKLTASYSTKIGKIKDPTNGSKQDFEATLRGLMKNMILLWEFKMKGEKHEESK